ncbi:biliverdin-producing heme oxygenase [Salegentibacter salegens]|uniref:Heme oxygenase/heme oxygenase n=1 Tax=Salegentibacter salegens TaxID=143223 RepID=A0A1M7HIL0_9FLAO|nr:biliverdin-producing heme oxygenase [Salegentibacter salegens]PRX44065.1 heme oxygenase/heme oxygenase [Salegentibacter salegens]SHM27987.1 heme oxygenase/heme oxygenase [Salegentibacter salegens]
MLSNLRNATQKLHEELEKENLAGQIISHDISLEDYKLLLLQNYIAYKITEAEIAKYIPSYQSDKSDQLAKDLENLKVDTSISEEFQDKFNITSYEEALGAAYVVLGSALGGMYISKEIPNCPELNEISRPNFFNGDREGLKAWNKFVKKLKAEDFNETQIAVASKKAQETFEFFGSVFRETSLIVQNS